MQDPASCDLSDLIFLRSIGRFAAAGRSRVLSLAEVDAVSYLAALGAWTRFRPDHGASFVTFARHHVIGAVRRAIAHRRMVWAITAPRESLEYPATGAASAEEVALAREVVERLDPVEVEVAVRVGDGESLADIARSHRRHPSWASRKLATARRRARQIARRAVMDTATPLS